MESLLFALDLAVLVYISYWAMKNDNENEGDDQ
jgi:hypothetical protein